MIYTRRREEKKTRFAFLRFQLFDSSMGTCKIYVYFYMLALARVSCLRIIISLGYNCLIKCNFDAYLGIHYIQFFNLNGRTLNERGIEKKVAHQLTENCIEKLKAFFSRFECIAFVPKNRIDL